MAKHDPSDPPPPYFSVAVHTQPPLKSYEEVVYGVGPGLTPPTQPHYIPQYPPPGTVSPVVRPSIPPGSKRKRCCATNSRCYGGSGGILLVLALMALAIWLGVRYGTKIATAAILYNEEDDHTIENPPVSKDENCPENPVQCDGIKDCLLGSDETVCVRFGESHSLQVKTVEDGRFLPVCARGWDQSYADQTCAQLGFKNSHATQTIPFQGSLSLEINSRSSSLIQGLVNVSSSCPGQEIVSLQCVDCGRQQSTSRIIGGSIAEVGQWPWQLTLHYRGSHVCGAVLVSPYFVLTAAHCFPSNPESKPLDPKDWKVYGGVVSLDRLPQPNVVEKILLNENYNSNTNDQDVALLKLASPAVFNDRVQPACLPFFNKRFTHGTKCWTSGFGTTDAGSNSVSNSLREVTVDIIESQVCNSPKMYGGTVTKNMICAGHESGGRDSCQGDSGGPLVCESGNIWYLAGITSWGSGCGRENKPGVYTKVTSVLPWIYSNMQREKP